MLFKQFERLLDVHESLNFTVSKNDKGELKVVVVAKFNQNDKANEDNEAVNKVRTALSVPLVDTDTADNLDNGFFKKVAQMAEQHQELNSLNLILEEAKKTATRSVVKKTKKTEPSAEKQPVAESPKAQPETSATDTTTEQGFQLAI